MKRLLIVGIVLILVFLALTIYHEIIAAPVNIYEITGKGLKEENKRVFLKATFVAGIVTNDHDNGFYVMFGDGVQYLVYMNNELANNINKYLLDHPDEFYYIEGYSKLIPSNLEENGKKFVKQWLDNNHHHETEEENHTHDITAEEFYKYFGYVYLDNNHGLSIIKLSIYLTGIIGAIFIISYLNKRYHLI